MPQPHDPQPEPPRYQPPPQHGRVVSKQRMSGSGHSIHAVLTLFTCGLWAPIWFLHWLFTRKKTVSRY